jgi:hydrogenase maturation protein HypF
MLRVRGTVQGVGFRPFVLRLASELGVRGWVRNDAEGVLIRALGDTKQLDQLALQVVSKAPAAARVTSVEWLDQGGAESVRPCGWEADEQSKGAMHRHFIRTANGFRSSLFSRIGIAPDPSMEDKFSPVSFTIIESGAPSGEIKTSAPVDLAPCDDCRRELNDPADRRHGYPFINCTQCGPRYTIIEHLPYDRPQTTMAAFTMCPACQREYENPADRRFHAEPNACPVCGPQLCLTNPDGNALAEGPAALERAVSALKHGGIVAVKGVGGFHLMTDAAAESAVAELRRRKHREEKPFAVMFRDVAMLREWAEVSSAAETLLKSPQRPIVLVPKHPERTLAAAVAPNNPWLGAMLPSSPLHLLLLDSANRPLIATSANLSDEPLCTDDDEARERLTGIADLFLGHNRAIARPVDDSIARFTPGGAAIVLRRARAHAPSPLELPAALQQAIICVGAQMKNTVAVASGRRLVLSPHIGDLGGSATHRVFARTIGALSSLLAAKSAAVVCDKHPDYHSTRFAIDSGLPRIAVQHHLAHVLAVLLEHRHPADGVLGVAWDGTGYGEDGTVWGGEFILLRSGRAIRFAHLKPFRLPGGEAAVRDARRVAVAMAGEQGGDVAERFGFSKNEAATLQAMMAQHINSPVCTSAGRLFDGFGALLGLGARNFFEGQIPLAVEAAAFGASPDGEALPFPVVQAAEGANWEIDWSPPLAHLLDNPLRDVPGMAAAFHRGLADAIVEVSRLADVSSVALSGGCFQNALLRHVAEARLSAAGFKVLAARELPPHDGAIAAGQALAALWNLTTVENPNPIIPCASPFPEK